MVSIRKHPERTSATLSTGCRRAHLKLNEGISLSIQLIKLIIPVFFFSTTSFADDWGDDWEDEEEQGVELHGFVEAGFGVFTDDNIAPTNSDASLAEVTARLELNHIWNDIDLKLKGDAHADGVVDEYAINIREATAKYSIGDFDITAGRQVLTWGTGDLLFLNDMFPKDYQSFFAGRDLEYLKSPSDAIKLGYFGRGANIDLVWMPEFEPDVFLTGERFSYFSPMAGQIVAAPPQISPQNPSEKLSNGELALRIYDTYDGIEWAVYGYRGFWGQPTAMDSAGNPTFAKLYSLGASIRSSLWGGIANSEFSYYLSSQDKDGTNSQIPNDQIRFLIGYERELLAKLTLGLQYYIEHTQDHEQLLQNSMFPQYEQDESRHLITTRFNYRVQRDKFNLSLFVFYSPTDNDSYLRPAVSYRIDDSWSFDVGANIFSGNKDHTFWGQFDRNDNVYCRVRFSY